MLVKPIALYLRLADVLCVGLKGYRSWCARQNKVETYYAWRDSYDQSLLGIRDSGPVCMMADAGSPLYTIIVPPVDGGSGRSLPRALLALCTLATIFTTIVSLYSILLQLKHYYKPSLQRYVVRILIMPLLYAVASTISLFSLQLAEMIDLMRDLYEAFVIYCFFSLLVEYLSGEGAMLVHLRGRPPKPHLFPLNLVLYPMDLSDPYTFLSLKRGILQYVQIKPVLAVVTVLLKMYGKYEDGHLHLGNGYTWTAIVYNFSVFVALYYLTVFWICLYQELAPFRVASKFICVKGVIFFSFWQGLLISILVAMGLVTHIGGVYDDTYLSTALQDILICLEMPVFAIAHIYAFSHVDYMTESPRLVGRMPFFYAVRDSFGTGDITADMLSTIYGTDYTYRSWEPSDDIRHHSYAFHRRSRAGLRYSEDGRTKYWLGDDTRRSDEETPLIRHVPKREYQTTRDRDELSELRFPDVTEEEDYLYNISRKLPFGDYKYPCIQAS